MQQLTLGTPPPLYHHHHLLLLFFIDRDCSEGAEWTEALLQAQY